MSQISKCILACALLGQVSALPVLTTTEDLTEKSSAPDIKTKLGDNQDGYAGYKCHMAMRIQKTATANYLAKDFFGSFAKKADVKFDASYLCAKTITEMKAGSKTFCKGTNNGAGTMNAGYAEIICTTGQNGNRIHGALACAQDAETCGASNKYQTFADSKATKTTLTMKVADDSIACSFVLAATCDSPFAQVAGGSDYTDDKYTDLALSVVEWQAVTGQQYTDDSRGFTTVFTGATKLTTDQIKTLLKDDYTSFADNAAGGNKNQGTKSPTVQLYAYKDDGSPVDVYAHLLLQVYKAKKAEVAAFETAKAAYETKRTAYNTALTAAEKLQKDEINKDMFRKMTPTEADLKILNAVPVRPNNPSAPAAYIGPVAANTGEKLANTVIVKTGDFALVGLETKTLTGKDLVPGKSFGLLGYGNMDGTDVDAAKNDGTSLGKGVIFRRADKDGKCLPNHMLLQIGVTDGGKTNAKEQKVHVGAEAALYSFDAITIPSAASDPQTPSTGASMLAAGAATVAIAMTLF